MGHIRHPRNQNPILIVELGVLVAAGVFEMRVLPFMLAVFAGRLVRWLVLSLLVLKLGPGAVSLMTDLVKDHLTTFLSALVLLFVAIGIWVVLKLRRKSDSADEGQALGGEINPMDSGK